MTLAGAVLEQLDGESIRLWNTHALACFTARRVELDALNVFPIADRDTGSNLVQTLSGAVEAVAELPAGATAAATLAAMARGAVLAAHGNSGIILAQFLQGFAGAVAGPSSGPVSGAQLAAAMIAGHQAAVEAVSEPAPGTILTVLAGAARAAIEQAAGPGADLAAVLTAAVQAARRALSETTSQLPELSAAGVVDAGGAGALVLIEALQAVIARNPIVHALPAVAQFGAVPAPAGEPAPALEPAPGAAAVLGLTVRFEVQYLLHADAGSVGSLRAALGALGDSVTIAAADDGLFAVHAHVADAGAAVEAGLQVGVPRQIRIAELIEYPPEHAAPGHAAQQYPAPGHAAQQYPAPGSAAQQYAAPEQAVQHQLARQRPSGDPSVPEQATTDPVIVALVASAQLGRIFQAEGVVVLLAATSTVDAVSSALLSCGSDRVVLLANSADAAPLVEAAAAQARRRGLGVAVVPTRSEVQGLAACAVHDRQRRFDDDVIAMAEAAAATRVAHLAVAQTESITYAGRCSAGDVLGLIDGEVVEIGSDYGRVAAALVRRLVAAGGELVTVLVGAADGADRAADFLRSYVKSRHQFVELAVLDGGAMASPIVIGVE